MRSPCTLNPEEPVWLDRSADCHPTFGRTHRFAVNILGPRHASLAVRFATKGGDKFAEETFVDGVLGAPRLPDAVATVECEVEARYPGGDHTILVGNVQHAHLGPETPVVYARRRFFDAPV
ncbi:flavin reductase family protein [Amycolatopsis nalaikhensis]|uniref:Flavin reductase family protein n=1 Tax=Amycolatopsis nalaikhensis TaxID=715472 RepID=A0ABY8Y247_9PSEU|nr:flavin reductase family protein [Amycolatopsis sp. 2-2]WIV62074.1 flavin reductase family protein [Amycolatopsis sp. 2-2]